MHVFKANNPATQLEGGWQKIVINFARNSQNILHTMSLPNISLADLISMLTNATTKNLQENKLSD